VKKKRTKPAPRKQKSEEDTAKNSKKRKADKSDDDTDKMEVENVAVRLASNKKPKLANSNASDLAISVDDVREADAANRSVTNKSNTSKSNKPTMVGVSEVVNLLSDDEDDDFQPQSQPKAEPVKFKNVEEKCSLDVQKVLYYRKKFFLFLLTPSYGLKFILNMITAGTALMFPRMIIKLLHLLGSHA
jgi:hypothetical protein